MGDGPPFCSCLLFIDSPFLLFYFQQLLQERPTSPLPFSRETKHGAYLTYVFARAYRYCVLKLTERLKREGIDINLRDALGVDTDPKLRNLRGKL